MKYIPLILLFISCGKGDLIYPEPGENNIIINGVNHKLNHEIFYQTNFGYAIELDSDNKKDQPYLGVEFDINSQETGSYSILNSSMDWNTTFLYDSMKAVVSSPVSNYQITITQNATGISGYFSGIDIRNDTFYGSFRSVIFKN